ncbi:MAG: hypothetical protein ACI9F9_001532 [Candidatus Paceibacteria bacterium]|jgi:hypothetical protein
MDMCPGPQIPANDLEQALAAMTFEVEPARFALCGFESPPETADLQLLGAGPGQLVREGGETSLLLEQNRVAELLQRHPAARVERGLVWIRFQAPMGWEVVGFLARVTSALAAAGIPLGAVCGYSRDHLFIHEKHLETSLTVLDELFPRTASA